MKTYGQMNNPEKEELLFRVLVENVQLRKDLDEAIETREFWYGEYQRLKKSAEVVSKHNIEPLRANGPALWVERVVEALDAKSV